MSEQEHISGDLDLELDITETGMSAAGSFQTPEKIRPPEHSKKQKKKEKASNCLKDQAVYTLTMSFEKAADNEKVFFWGVKETHQIRKGKEHYHPPSTDREAITIPMVERNMAGISYETLMSGLKALVPIRKYNDGDSTSNHLEKVAKTTNTNGALRHNDTLVIRGRTELHDKFKEIEALAHHGKAPENLSTEAMQDLSRAADIFNNIALHANIEIHRASNKCKRIKTINLLQEMASSPMHFGKLDVDGI